MVLLGWRYGVFPDGTIPLGGGEGEAENAERGRMCSNQWGFPNIVTQIKFLSSNPGLGITSPSLSL